MKVREKKIIKCQFSSIFANFGLLKVLESNYPPPKSLGTRKEFDRSSSTSRVALREHEALYTNFELTRKASLTKPKQAGRPIAESE